MNGHYTRRTAACLQRGFTFLEIMMVVMIIMVLAALVGPRLVGKGEKAKKAAARGQIESIKTSLGLYEMQVGGFPTSDEGLQALVTRPSGVPEETWEKAMDEIPLDPWREPYVYKFPSDHGGDYDLYSKGPDGREGTDDDITNFPRTGDGDDF